MLNLVMPFLVWAGKFVFIISIMFWSASGWLFSYLSKYNAGNSSGGSGTVSPEMIRRGRRLIRGFGSVSATVAVLLMIEVYRRHAFSGYYLSFSVSAIITVFSYIVLSEILLIPSLRRYEYLNDYISQKNLKGNPAHSLALSNRIRALSFYQLIPALFVVLTISFQFSIY